MTKTLLAKYIASAVASYSVGKTVMTIAKNNASPDSPIGNLTYNIGAMVIAAMVSDKANVYVCHYIDSLVEQYQKIQTEKSV